MSGTYTAYLSGAPERLLILPTNIRLDWKDLPGTNALLAYYEKTQLTAVKSFITLVPERIIKNYFKIPPEVKFANLQTLHNLHIGLIS